MVVKVKLMRVKSLSWFSRSILCVLMLLEMKCLEVSIRLNWKVVSMVVGR